METPAQLADVFAQLQVPAAQIQNFVSIAGVLQI